MLRIKLLLGTVLCLSLLNAEIKAQAILTLQERADDGKVESLNIIPAISDINSQISISLDKDNIRAKIGSSSSMQELLADLKFYAEIMQKMTPNLKAFQQADPSNAQAYLSALQQLALVTLPIIEYANQNRAQEPELVNKLNSISLDVNQSYKDVFNILKSETEELRQQIDKALEEEGYKLKMGAWLVSSSGQNPVNLPGFDAYQPQAPYRVENWNFNISQQQKAEFERIKGAIQNNSGVLGTMADVSGVTAELSKPIKIIKDCVAKLEDTLNTLISNLDSSQAALINNLNALKTDLDNFKALANNLISSYSQLSNETDPTYLLSKTQSDVDQLINQTKILLNKLESFKNTNGTILNSLASDILAFGTATDNQVNSCITEIGKISASINNLKTYFTSLFRGKEINDNLFQFGDKVTSHTLEQLPSSTELNLILAGKRSAGDQIYLKIAYQKKDQQDATLESHNILLYQVNWHVESKAGLLFADPWAETEVSAPFQMAPSYNVLFKKGSRKSVVRNTLFNLSWGLNISSLDFNKDDVPEVGIAAVVSYFNDYLQLGLGYNMFEDVPYMAVGFRLPLANIFSEKQVTQTGSN